MPRVWYYDLFYELPYFMLGNEMVENSTLFQKCKSNDPLKQFSD